MPSNDRKQARAQTRRGKERQAWASAGLKADPIEKGLPHPCAWQKLSRGAQPRLSKFGKTPGVIPSLAGTCRSLQSKWSGGAPVPWSQVKLPSPQVLFGGV